MPVLAIECTKRGISLVLVNESIVQAVDPTQPRNIVHLTLTPELGGDREFRFADLDLTFESAEAEVFAAIDRALRDDGIQIPRNSYTLSRNANSQTLSLHPKSGFGA